jgi:hypothetical protein
LSDAGGNCAIATEDRVSLFWKARITTKRAETLFEQRDLFYRNAIELDDAPCTRSAALG